MDGARIVHRACEALVWCLVAAQSWADHPAYTLCDKNVLVIYGQCTGSMNDHAVVGFSLVYGDVAVVKAFCVKLIEMILAIVMMTACFFIGGAISFGGTDSSAAAQPEAQQKTSRNSQTAVSCKVLKLVKDL